MTLAGFSHRQSHLQKITRLILLRCFFQFYVPFTRMFYVPFTRMFYVPFTCMFYAPFTRMFYVPFTHMFYVPFTRMFYVPFTHMFYVPFTRMFYVPFTSMFYVTFTRMFLIWSWCNVNGPNITLFSSFLSKYLYQEYITREYINIGIPIVLSIIHKPCYY
jgi:hypothetical protein